MKNFFEISTPSGINPENLLQQLSRAKTSDCLHILYNTTDELYGQRLQNQKDIEKIYKKYLVYIDEMMPCASEDDIKLALLVKSNIFLRLGQLRSEAFERTEEEYAQAAKCLELGSKIMPDRNTLDSVFTKTDLLLSLNLGKYFRNIGKSGHKNYFQTAVNIFDEIKLQLENRWKQVKSKQIWEVHLWLDVTVNLGRVKENFYYDNSPEASAETFPAPLMYYGAIAGLTAQLLKNNLFSDTYKKITCLKYLPQNAMGQIWDSEITPILQKETNSNFLKDYFIQALVRTCIVYRKQRDYKIALDLCDLVNSIDSANIDIINNKSVCYRKVGKIHEALSLIEPISIKNRFATINFWKCCIKDIGDKGTNLEKKLISTLDRNKNDLEVKMLLALRLRETGRWEAALDVYQEIYESSPYIKRGTIGLKAYFNISCCLIHQKNYHQAIKILEHILTVYPDDILATIDHGWCLINLGHISEACELYEKLMKSDSFCKLSTKNQMKVYNNYSEALLKSNNDQKAEKIIDMALEVEENNGRAFYIKACCHLARGRKETSLAEYETSITYLEKAIYSGVADLYADSDIISIKMEIIDKIFDWDNPQSESHARYILDQLILFPAKKYSLKTCSDLAFFIEKTENKIKDCSTVPKWLDPYRIEDLYKGLSRVLFINGEEGSYKFRHILKQKEFMELEAEDRGRILAILFKIFANVMAIKEQCRITMFSGKQVIGTQSCNNSIFSIPAHYTSLKTLKILLGDTGDTSKICSAVPDSPKDVSSLNDFLTELDTKKHKTCTPRLRLWNTVYMNDPYEGETFIQMLKSARESTPDNQKRKLRSDTGRKNSTREATPNNQKSDILARYFPYMNNPIPNVPGNNAGNSDRITSLSPVSNVYITSFSEDNDGIQMWVNYADKAKGVNFILEEGFFDIYHPSPHWGTASVYSDKDLPLYRVQYISSSKGNIFNKTSDDFCSIDLEKTKVHLNQIYHYMDEMEDRLPNLKPLSAIDSRNSAIRGFVADMLNEIRFLFKDPEYKHEKELRLIRCSYIPKIDFTAFEIPRLYIDVEKELRIAEVKLGPKYSTEEANEIVSWLHSKNNVKKITRSERHYR